MQSGRGSGNERGGSWFLATWRFFAEFASLAAPETRDLDQYQPIGQMETIGELTTMATYHYFRCSVKLLAACSATVLMFSGCVPHAVIKKAETAVARIDRIWQMENAEVLRQYGSRNINGSKDHVILTTKRALKDIGLDVVSTDEAGGEIVAERVLTDADIKANVYAVELPRLRAIFVQELGSIGNKANLTAEGFKIVIVLGIDQNRNGVVLSVKHAFPVDLRPETRLTKSTTQVAPTALRGGLYEFWRSFDRQYRLVQTGKSEPSRPRLSMSDWVIPPTNWVLPPVR